MTRVEKALALHAGGSSCAQSVFAAFAGDYGLDSKAAHRLSSCLGAGLGRQQLVCGAISGGALVLGLALGNEEGADSASKERAYEAAYGFAEAAKAEFGAANCRDLLEGLDLRDPADKAEFTARGLRARVCERMIARCVELLEARLPPVRPTAAEGESRPLPGLALRKAEAADAGIVASFRYRMFVDMHPEEDYGAMREALEKGTAEYHLRRVMDPDYLVILAEVEGKPIGSGALFVDERPPHAKRLMNRTGYIASVYVEPEFRGRGAARAIMAALRDEAKERGARRLALHSSDLGMPLYRSLGYAANPSYLELDL